MMNDNKKVILATAPVDLFEKWVAPPLGLAYIASCLEREGYNVEIVDCHLNYFSIKKSAEIISNKKADVVGFSAFTINRFNVIEIIRKIKKSNPNTLIITGGPHFSVTAEDTLRNVPEIDVVVIGEGETTTTELLNAYFSNKPLQDIKGICFRGEGNKIIITEFRPPIKDLDSLPMPAYHLLELKKYKAFTYYFTNLTKEEKKLPSAGVVSSRGCPNSCIFCANNTELLKTFFRKREPKKFVDEIQFLYKNYDFKIFNFWDDTFTLSKEYVLDICNEIIQRKLNIKWYVRARVNTVDGEMLEKMKEAGCIAVLYGVESGSDKILKVIKKNITTEQVKNIIMASVNMGLDVLTGFMISFPQETKDDVEKTMALVRELRSYSNKVYEIDLAPTVIYPGTIIEKIAMDEGRIFPKDFSWNKKFEFQKNKQLLVSPYIPIYTQNFTLEEIMAYRLRNKLQQQLRKSKIKLLNKAIGFIKGIRSFQDLKTLFLIYSSLKNNKNKQSTERKCHAAN